MKTSLQIKIIIPLVPVYAFEENLLVYVEEAIDELIKLDQQLKFEILDLGSFSTSIYVIGNHKSKSNKFNLKSNAIVFQILIPNDYKKMVVESSDKNELSDSDRQSLFENVASNEFREKLYYFLILTQIAKPGGIKSWEGEVLVNDKLVHHFYSLSSIHRESFNEVEKLKWPTYQNIKLEDVWNWFLENTFSFQRHSKSNIERALNAFTYLFKDNSIDIVFDLFWSLIGIEALYCSGKEGLSEQIFNKTQVLLRPLTDYKKRLKQMYEFRSRLVHGDMDIPPNHYDSVDDDDEKFHQNLYESASLSVSILTATFQTMIVSKKNNLDFRYIID